VYYISYATGVLRVPLPTVLTLLLGAAVLFAMSVLLSARWADRLGHRRVMLWGNAGLVAASAVFFPLIDTGSVLMIGLALGSTLLVQGVYIGTQPAVFAELFAPDIRYSGTSLSNTLGTILGGAVAPSIAASLYAATGSSTAIGVYVTALAAVSLWSAIALRTATVSG